MLPFQNYKKQYRGVGIVKLSHFQILKFSNDLLLFSLSHLLSLSLSLRAKRSNLSLSKTIVQLFATCQVQQIRY